MKQHIIEEVRKSLSVSGLEQLIPEPQEPQVQPQFALPGVLKLPSGSFPNIIRAYAPLQRQIHVLDGSMLQDRISQDIRWTAGRLRAKEARAEGGDVNAYSIDSLRYEPGFRDYLLVSYIIGFYEIGSVKYASRVRVLAASASLPNRQSFT